MRIISDVKENQRIESPPEGHPEITPDMVQSVFSALDAEGLIFHAEDGAYIPTETGWKLLRDSPSGKEVILAKGHEKIIARDEDCFEITMNKDPRGEDSVICVCADKGCKDLDENFKNALKTASKVEITIEAGDAVEKVVAFGSPALKLTDSNEIVIRKSDFIDGKTAAILSDKSANDFDTIFKEKLRDPRIEVKITLELK